MIRYCIALMLIELKTLWITHRSAYVLLAFFVITLSIFPLTFGSEPNLLHSMGASSLWVALLYMMMMSLPHLYERDYLDGTLEVLATSPYAMPLTILSKIKGLWIGIILPLLLFLPILGYLYHQSWDEVLRIGVGFLLASPTLLLLGSMIAAMTLGIRKSPAIIAVLMLPLAIPVMVFATSLTENHQPLLSHPSFYLLIGIFFGMLPLSLIVTSASLRFALEDTP